MLAGKKIELHMNLRLFGCQYTLQVEFRRVAGRGHAAKPNGLVWGDHAFALTVAHSIQTASLTLPLIGYPQSPTAQKPATGIAGIVALLVSGISHKKADRIHKNEYPFWVFSDFSWLIPRRNSIAGRGNG